MGGMGWGEGGKQQCGVDGEKVADRLFFFQIFFQNDDRPLFIASDQSLLNISLDAPNCKGSQVADELEVMGHDWL